MKKNTLIGISLGLLTLTMSAQQPQSSSLNTGSRLIQEGSQMQAPASSEQIQSMHGNQTSNANRSPEAELLSEGFDDITTLPDAGFSFVNVSDEPLLTWDQGFVVSFSSHEGAPDSYISVNFNSTAGSVINNFMITPVLNLENGDEITFWTRAPENSGFPDRLEVRLDPTGANNDPSDPEDIGSYTELLLEINPDLTPGGYPVEWTEYRCCIWSYRSNRYSRCI